MRFRPNKLLLALVAAPIAAVAIWFAVSLMRDSDEEIALSPEAELASVTGWMPDGMTAALASQGMTFPAGADEAVGAKVFDGRALKIAALDAPAQPAGTKAPAQGTPMPMPRHMLMHGLGTTPDGQFFTVEFRFDSVDDRACFALPATCASFANLVMVTPSDARTLYTRSPSATNSGLTLLFGDTISE